MRIALGIEYDGTGYSGWQIQSGQPTVQGAVEAALSRVADHPVAVVCAGRTDAGVHAREQVVHFDTEAVRTSRSWLLGSNVNLPPDISVLWAQPVEQTFHARFSARSRVYRYRILERAARPALQRNHTCWTYRKLDVELMHQAAQSLVGAHDFSAYRAVACQAHSPVRQVEYINVDRQGETIAIEIKANAFLHHMVRNIAGVLMAIGGKEQDVGWTREILETRDRTRGGVTAPPQGLCLMQVIYPPEFDLPCTHSGIMGSDSIDHTYRKLLTDAVLKSM